MEVSLHLPLEELVRLERAEKNAARSKRLRIIILALGGYTAPAIAMSLGLSRRICQRWVYRYNEEGLEGLNDRRGEEPQPTLTPQQEERVCQRLEAGPTPEDQVCSLLVESRLRRLRRVGGSRRPRLAASGPRR